MRCENVAHYGCLLIKEHCAPAKHNAAVVQIKNETKGWELCLYGWLCMLGLTFFFLYCLDWAEFAMAVFLWSHSYCHWELAGINVLWNKSLFCLDIRRSFSCDTALARCPSAAFGHWHCWVSLQSCCNDVIVDLKPRKSHVIALATILHWFCLRCYNIPALIRSVVLLEIEMESVFIGFTLQSLFKPKY